MQDYAKLVGELMKVLAALQGRCIDALPVDEYGARSHLLKAEENIKSAIGEIMKTRG